MKNLFSLFFVVLIFSGCAVLKTVPLTKDSIIVEVKGKTASELYEAIRFYVSETWNDPEHVTRYEEKSENKISVNGVLYSETKNVASLSYVSEKRIIKGSLVFYVKEGRFKIVAKNITTKLATIDYNGNSKTEDNAPGIIPGQENILETYANDIKQLIKSESNTMDF